MRLDRIHVDGSGIGPSVPLVPRHRSFIMVIALASIVASGCSDATGPSDEPGPPDTQDPPAPVIGSVGVVLEDRTLSVEQTTRAHAIVVDEDGDPLPSETVVFGSSDDDVLIVSSTGLVTAIAPGTARVTARIGDHTGETRVFVRRAADPAAIYARVGDRPGGERYVFYADSTFELTTSSEVDQDSFSFPGWYSQTGTMIALDFFDDRRRWHATGAARGDTLFVEYNLVMGLSGFTDGVFVRTATGPSPSGDASPRLLIPDGQDPAWSADGAGIAFTNTRDGEPVIYVANADGSAVRRLTGGSWPAWSPDGRSIAFHRAGLIGWGNGEVRVIDVDGSNERALARGEFPAWSPDGARIVFADDEGISAMNADGSGITRLLRGDFLAVTPSIPNGIGKPAWSPDGSRITFEHVGDGDLTPAQIYVMNADGSSPRRLTSTRGIQYAESDPAWSADGTRLVFWSYGFGIATIHANGGAVRSVHKDFPTVSYGSRPAWSPDGRIAFTVGVADAVTGIWVVDSGP